MVISDSLRESLRRGTFGNQYAISNFNTTPENILPIQVVIDLSKELIEIPTLFVETCKAAYRHGYNKVVISAGSNNHCAISSPDSIVRHTFDRPSYSNFSMNKVITNKGEIYYGTTGMILDSNLNPLILSTQVYDREFHYKKSIIHLHPSVFLDDTKSINRLLSKKALCYYLTANVPDHNVVQNYEVVIDKSENLFVPVPPKHPINTKNIPNFLKKNIGELIEQFKEF